MSRPPTRRRRRSPKSKPRPVCRRLEIGELGHRGDGVAETDGGRVFVPFTLAGEVVEAGVAGDRGVLKVIVHPSPERVDPPCPRFGACGGCAVQHLAADAYAEWKRGLVAAALGRRDLDADVEALIDAHGAGRRRATLHVRGDGAARRVGFMAARSHDLVDIEGCLVLAPELAGAPEIAAAAARPFAGAVDVQITATESGLDADVRTVGGLDYDAQVALADLAERFDLARVTLAGEIVAERRKPWLAMGTARVTPPPAGFLQATAAGEAALADLVTSHLAGAARVADLHAGVGPFALRLAGEAAVHAVDSDEAALAALGQAVRFTQNLKPVTTEVRDLDANPLLADELRSFDGVVFDPPRAGARAQAEQLAAAAVPRVAAVSCDPSSFARDAAILAAGGYGLERVQPVDQFKHSAHVEIVGLFRRGP